LFSHDRAVPGNTKQEARHKPENDCFRKGEKAMAKSKRDAGEMPIGLMMSLAMHPDAMRNFSTMNDERQKSVIRYVEDAKTGGEAKDRIGSAVDELEKGNTGFFG
jgi:uncharacterized protein YdeI (YjbR/CyaY-like superfamily)